MPAKLRISEELSLPLEAITQTFALLAKRGSGKTYTAAVMVEEMAAANLPVAVVDPVGVLWGLRASADGKGPGLPVVILGGEHGDVPLEPDAGEIIADFVIEARRPVVLDLSLFRKGEQARFVTTFAERLYHKNREPLHLVIDEADLFAPQRPMPGEQRMLGAIEDIVRRGRARGLGVTLITQRPAVLHKDVLTQVEVLVALRLIAPQDRAAIDAWVKVHGTPEQRDELMGSLPSLPIGTAWFWSPGWLDVFQRVKIRKRRTFDSSATPTMGSKVTAPAQLAPVDIELLRERISATIEKAKQEDPRELRKRIAELEREVKAKAPAAAPAKVERVEVPIVDLASIDKLNDLVNSAIDSIGRTARQARDDVHRHFVEHRTEMRRSVKATKPGLPAAPAKTQGAGRVEPVVMTRAPERLGKLGAASGDAGVALSKLERGLLTALAQYPEGRTRAQVLTLAGYRASGDVSTAFARFTSEGWTTAVDRATTKITEAGLVVLGSFDPLPTGDALIAHWQEKLDLPASTLFRVIVQHRGAALPRGEIIQAAGYKPSGDISTAFAMMSRLELINVGRAGISLNDEVFS